MKHNIVKIGYPRQERFGPITDPRTTRYVAICAGMELRYKIFKETDLVLTQFDPPTPTEAEAATRSSREKWIGDTLHIWLEGDEKRLGKHGMWNVHVYCVEMPDAFHIFQRRGD